MLTHIRAAIVCIISVRLLCVRIPVDMQSIVLAEKVLGILNVCTHLSSSSLDDAPIEQEDDVFDSNGDLNNSGDVDLGVDGAVDGTEEGNSSQTKSYSK